ncbi:hypothetical protein [Pseudooceanicola atlanticus]|uniref:Nicotinate phosphoribosyltransferase n=1 Tax=Pseudooceanicola atlanticus TaxID=1461694 RepID=A0A0A0EGW9_9RHOB|nr:hypothetical protein [Pseudooceanicola atlanticus]KGM49333.1 hypothetical protein ATO9_04690 [Pseudooceanicola atlanticus]
MTFRTKSLSLAAILAASVSGAALAQGVSVGTGGDAGASVGTGNGAASVGASLGADASADAAGNMSNGNGSADMGADADMDTDMAADTGDTMEDGTDAMKQTYGAVVSSLQTGTNAEADIGSIDADSEISTMTVSELQGNAGENAQALDNALADAELTDFHAMIDGNAELKAALEAEGFEAEDVIGVYSTADNSFEVLVDDRG